LASELDIDEKQRSLRMQWTQMVNFNFFKFEITQCRELWLDASAGSA
jgi:hypothetical protein